MISDKLTIGVFGIGLDVYWEQFEGLKTCLESHLEIVCSKFADQDVNVVNAGIVDTVDKAFKAGKNFRQTDVDIVFLYVGTYALSETVLPVVQRLNVPVVVLNLAPEKRIDYEMFNSLNDRTKMTGIWLKYCAACPVPEIAMFLDVLELSFTR
jgi:L-arabinose isomerase